MAIYVPPSTRRRRLVGIAVAGLVVGALAGYGLGRSTATGLDDALDSVRGKAEDAATALQRIPIEYEQAVAGAGGESTATITEAIDRARAQLDDAWAEAEWFGPDARVPVDEALDTVEEAVADEVAPAAFEAAVDDAVEVVEDAFGLAIGQGT